MGEVTTSSPAAARVRSRSSKKEVESLSSFHLKYRSKVAAVETCESITEIVSSAFILILSGRKGKKTHITSRDINHLFDQIILFLSQLFGSLDLVIDLPLRLSFRFVRDGELIVLVLFATLRGFGVVCQNGSKRDKMSKSGARFDRPAKRLGHINSKLDSESAGPNRCNWRQNLFTHHPHPSRNHLHQIPHPHPHLHPSLHHHPLLQKT